MHKLNDDEEQKERNIQRKKKSHSQRQINKQRQYFIIGASGFRIDWITVLAVNLIIFYLFVPYHVYRVASFEPPSPPSLSLSVCYFIIMTKRDKIKLAINIIYMVEREFTNRYIQENKLLCFTSIATYPLSFFLFI